MFGCLGLQLVQDELSRAHWCAQDGDSPATWITLGISSPHSGLRVHPFSDCLQCLDTVRNLSTLVENASLALIQTDPRMFPQLFCQDVVAIHCAVWSRQRIQIIEESHEPLTLIHAVRRLQESGMLTKGEEPVHTPHPEGCGEQSRHRPPTRRLMGCCGRVSRTAGTCLLLPSETTLPSGRFWR